MSDPLFVDRDHLQTKAYADSAHLNARVAIYDYQRPKIDLIAWVISQVDWRGDEHVLDIGCGPGRYLRRLAERHPQIQLIGMDLSRGMLVDTRNGWAGAAPGLSLAVADAQAIPLQDASCDITMAMHMLYHVPDIARTAAELRRVLRPGGTLLAATNGADHTRELNELYNTAVANLTGYSPQSLKWSSRFTLEGGAAALQTAFGHVERRDAISTLEIPEPAPLLGYLNSMRATHEPDLPADLEWETVIAEAERLAHETIARSGIFRVHTHAGVFICH